LRSPRGRGDSKPDSGSHGASEQQGQEAGEPVEILTGPVQIKTTTTAWYNSFVVIDFRSCFSFYEEREKF
jgi:hypothetical protein